MTDGNGQEVLNKDAQVVDSQPKSKMWYRINATRNMTGGRKIQPNQKMNDKMKEVRAVLQYQLSL